MAVVCDMEACYHPGVALVGPEVICPHRRGTWLLSKRSKLEESDWELQIRDVGDELVLSVKGLDVGKIVSASEPFTKEKLQDSKKLATAIQQCLEQARHMLRDDSESRQDLMLTFICGINEQNKDAETDGKQGSQYDNFVEWCKASGNLTTPVNRQQASIPEYPHCMWRSMNRRFFVTADGKVGMGPYATRPGDHMCILSGTQGVFILRPEGPRWRLVGDSYCRKFMKVGS